MAQITGNQYLNKYGSLPGGYNGSDYMTKMFDEPASRTVDAGAYTNKVNNPAGINWQQQLQDLMGQSSKAQQALLDAYKNPTYKAPDYSQFMQPLKGPDYSSLQGLISQSAGLKNQANTMQNTLEDLPETLQALYRDTGIAAPQLQRTTAIQSEPIIKSLERLIRASGVLDQQVGQGRELARDQYQTDVQNRQFGLQGMQLQDQSNRSMWESQMKGLELGAQMPTQQIGLLEKLKQMLTPQYEYFEDENGERVAWDPETQQMVRTGIKSQADYQYFTDSNTGNVSVFDPRTGKIVQTLPGVTGAARTGGGGGGGIPIPGIGNVKLTAAQQAAVVDAQNTLGNISQINQLLSSGVNTGPLAGMFNSLFGRGTNTSEYRQRAIQLQSGIEQLRANFQKALSGAAVSEQEAKRLARFLPSINDQESVIRNKLLTLQSSLQNIIQNNFMAGGGNYQGFGSSGNASDYGSQYGF